MSSPTATDTGAELPPIGEDGRLHLFDKSQLDVADFVVIVFYFLSVLTVGIWVREKLYLNHRVSVKKSYFKSV